MKKWKNKKISYSLGAYWVIHEDLTSQNKQFQKEILKTKCMIKDFYKINIIIVIFKSANKADTQYFCLQTLQTSSY